MPWLRTLLPPFSMDSPLTREIGPIGLYGHVAPPEFPLSSLQDAALWLNNKDSSILEEQKLSILNTFGEKPLTSMCMEWIETRSLPHSGTP